LQEAKAAGSTRDGKKDGQGADDVVKKIHEKVLTFDALP
jgi:hypothetical protein